MRSALRTRRGSRFIRSAAARRSTSALLAARPGHGLDLTGLSKIVDYTPRDMTILVEAGVRMADLAATLAAEGQQLPIDVPRAAEATIGGVVATNWNGPRRYGHGTIRDYVIGIHAVDGRGVPFKGGGRVVKNVAGYDFCKLLTGSLGTLGVITQLALKVKPLPEQSETVVAACARPRCCRRDFGPPCEARRASRRDRPRDRRCVEGSCGPPSAKAVSRADGSAARHRSPRRHRARGNVAGRTGGERDYRLRRRSPSASWIAADADTCGHTKSNSPIAAPAMRATNRRWSSKSPCRRVPSRNQFAEATGD